MSEWHQSTGWPCPSQLWTYRFAPSRTLKAALILSVILILILVASAHAQEVEHFKKRDAEVLLVRANGGVGFKMRSQRGQNTCELEGRAEFVTPTSAAYTSNDMSDACVAVMNFKDGKLTVTTKGCNGRCGLNAGGTIDGVYSAAR